MIRSHSRRRPQTVEAIQKPRGTFHPRVQKVAPQHFGIVSVDCAKARSKWMLADFFGNILVPPTVVEHNRTFLLTFSSYGRANGACRRASNMPWRIRPARSMARSCLS